MKTFILAVSFAFSGMVMATATATGENGVNGNCICQACMVNGQCNDNLANEDRVVKPKDSGKSFNAKNAKPAAIKQ